MSGNSYTFIKLVKDYSLEIFYSSKINWDTWAHLFI